ncbi:hypothetical protein [Jiella mangrovi]|uniref:TerY-C metal binding domain-containing protein n=1 Tax=Jiella mangrovi TaxID=2821407 RepID=A0ABS4BNP5_9HYPH|nr:hypothetical protein [Jiella mangrovi]MBP0618310.1 hypothetical protein [Jiella mangrovi]
MSFFKRFVAAYKGQIPTYYTGRNVLCAKAGRYYCEDITIRDGVATISNTRKLPDALPGSPPGEVALEDIPFKRLVATDTSRSCPYCATVTACHCQCGGWFCKIGTGTEQTCPHCGQTAVYEGKVSSFAARKTAPGSGSSKLRIGSGSGQKLIGK